MMVTSDLSVYDNTHLKLQGRRQDGLVKKVMFDISAYKSDDFVNSRSFKNVP